MANSELPAYSDPEHLYLDTLSKDKKEKIKQAEIQLEFKNIVFLKNLNYYQIGCQNEINYYK